MSTASDYRDLAPHFYGVYQQWSLGIADDPELIALIDELPEPKRQPNLVFGASQYLGCPNGTFSDYRAWLLDHWPAVRGVAQRRQTQTNEVGRCATLLPALLSLPQPLALLEVGASAGLCLYPDRYRYRYNAGPVLGSCGPILDCTIRGLPVPDRRPEVVWRAGLDLNPLDVTSAEDLRWLECLIWPGRPERVERLRAAAAVAMADPPRLVRGDLRTDLPALAALAAQAPAGATLVVFHSAVLAYLDAADRTAFAGTVADLPGHWLANEAPGVFAQLDADGMFLLTLDGVPIARTGPHGHSVHGLP